MRLDKSFYLQTDVVNLARELLGKVLVTNIEGKCTSGMIVETEAYAGVIDKASHAYGGRRTRRTETMFQEGGVAYVYLCYGIHNLFNVVTNVNGIPHAVLIRGVEPLEGIDVMLGRRGMNQLKHNITAGPGILSTALGIDRSLDNVSLLGNDIYIEDRGLTIANRVIIADTRVGIGYAKEDAYLPYRFYIKGNSFVSKGKGIKKE